MRNVAVPRDTAGRNELVMADRHEPGTRRGGEPMVVGSAVTARRSRSRGGWIAACVALAISGGCTTTNDSPPPDDPAVDAAETAAETSTWTEPTSTVAGVDEVERDALATYRAMWKDFVAAGRSSDWQAPGLGRHATGIALQKLTRGLYTDHQNGVVTRGEPVLDPRVSSVEPATNPTKVVVTDCGDSTNYLKYDATTGQLADDEPGGRRLINATVESQPDGSWKVSDFGIHEVGSCG